MSKFLTLFLFIATTALFAGVEPGQYANLTDELLVPPISAAMAGSDLSTGSGVSVESTPGNLPFDSLNHLSLSYAGFYGNTFNTSLVSYQGRAGNNFGVSMLLGYVYVPNIVNTTASDSTEDGALRELKTSYFSASRIIMRAGVGRLFTLTRNITLGAGVALNAKRIRLPETGYGIGMDAGVKVLFNDPGISVAMQLENITSSYTYWTKDFQERAYQHCRVGVGYERYFPYMYGSLQVNYASPDLFANEGINSYTSEKTENDNYIETPKQEEIYDNPALLATMGRYGIEYTIMNAVSFRGGLFNGKAAFGAGLHLLNNRAGIDIAYITHALAGTYQLSVNYTW